MFLAQHSIFLQKKSSLSNNDLVIVTNALTANTAVEQVKVIWDVELGADVAVMWCQLIYVMSA